MPTHRKIAAICSAALALFAAPLAVPAAQAQDVPESPAQIQLSFSPVVKTAAPAVVNVYSRRVVRTRAAPSIFDFMFGGELGAPTQERVEQSLGSGVIVDGDGVIVTNNHVVEGAQELKVALNDGREYEAELLLADERTDLAVLRIDGDELPSLDIGRSSDLEVGDLVLAIGNPFGVGQTVTSGIVSALARTDVGITDYSFFIQTDAAVNPGNSGGALVALDGSLVGVNTAIFSRSGGSNGIGFAIPAELVSRVVETALEGGEVVRPWLGARVQKITPELASSLGLARPQGALVSEVYPGGPADDAGLQVGDVITAVDGAPVNDLAGVRFLLATHRIGDAAVASVLREGQARDIRIAATAPPESPARNELQITGRNPFQGATVANLSPAFADEIGLDPLETGVIITNIARGTAADYFRLRPGDRVVEVGDQRIGAVDDLAAMLERFDGAESWPLEIRRGEQVFDQTVRM